MNKKLIDALDTCLLRMEHGEPLEYILAGYPDLAAQLRPLLLTAMQARSASREPFPQALLARQRSLGLSLAADLRQGKIHQPLFRRYWRTAVTVFLVIVIMIMSSNGILVASAHSIPGDSLYPIKLSVESTQLHLVSDLAQRQALEQTFSARRVDETKSLIAIRRIADVNFTGVVISRSGDDWLVSGIPVVLDGQVDIDTGIEIGDDIDVHGSTDSDGHVEAWRLSFAKASDADDVAPDLSQTPTPSLTPQLESDVITVPPASTPVPGYSGEDGNKNNGIAPNDRQFSISDKDHSSGEKPHDSQPNPEGEGDH